MCKGEIKMILVALAAAIFIAVPIEMFINYVDHHH